MTDPVTTGCVLLGIGAAHLGYTYFGYPWIVSLLPTRRARRAVDRTPERVSIVIAARDPGTAVAEKVSELLLSKTVACEIGSRFVSWSGRWGKRWRSTWRSR